MESDDKSIRKMDEHYYIKYGLKQLVINIERWPGKLVNRRNVATNPGEKVTVSPERQITPRITQQRNKIKVLKRIPVFKRKKNRRQTRKHNATNKITSLNSSSSNETITKSNCTSKENLILLPSECKAQTLSHNNNSNDGIQSDSQESCNRPTVTYGSHPSKLAKTSLQTSPCENCKHIINFIVSLSKNVVENCESSLKSSESASNIDKSPEKSTLSCPFTCSYEFLTVEVLKCHISDYHLMCRCKIMSKKNAPPVFDENSLQSHTVNYDCPFCALAQSTYDDLEKHLLTNHQLPSVSENNPREKPNYLFTISTNFLEKNYKNSAKNKKRNEDELTLKGKNCNSNVNCMICFVKFTTVAGYLLHIKKYHKPSDFLEFWHSLENSSPNVVANEFLDSEDSEFDFNLPDPSAVLLENKWTSPVEKLDGTFEKMSNENMPEKLTDLARIVVQSFENSIKESCENSMKDVIEESQNLEDLIENIVEKASEKLINSREHLKNSFEKIDQKSVTFIEKNDTKEPENPSPKRKNSYISLNKSPKKLVNSKNLPQTSFEKNIEEKNNDIENSHAAMENLETIENNQDEIYKDYEFLEPFPERQTCSISSIPTISLKNTENVTFVEHPQDPYDFSFEDVICETLENSRKRQGAIKDMKISSRTKSKKRKVEIDNFTSMKVIKAGKKSFRQCGKIGEICDPDYTPNTWGKCEKLMKNKKTKNSRESPTKLKQYVNLSSDNESYENSKKHSQENLEKVQQIIEDQKDLSKIPKIHEERREIFQNFDISKKNNRINKTHEKNTEIFNFSPRAEENYLKNLNEFITIPKDCENSSEISKNHEKCAVHSNDTQNNQLSKNTHLLAAMNAQRTTIQRNAIKSQSFLENTEKEEKIWNFPVKYSNENSQLFEQLVKSDKKPMCPQCNRIFPSRKELAKHFYIIQPYRRNTNNSKELLVDWNCALCKMTFNTLQLLLCHRYLVHKDESTIHICENCCQISTTIDMVNEHRCLGVKTFACKPCGKMFINSYTLYLHNRKEHHEEPGVYSCPICQRKFLTKSMRTRHRARCKGDNNNVQLYRCNVCNVFWRNSEELMNHVNVMHNHTETIEVSVGLPKAHDPIVSEAKTQRLLESHPEEEVGRFQLPKIISGSVGLPVITKGLSNDNEMNGNNREVHENYGKNHLEDLQASKTNEDFIELHVNASGVLDSNSEEKTGDFQHPEIIDDFPELPGIDEGPSNDTEIAENTQRILENCNEGNSTNSQQLESLQDSIRPYSLILKPVEFDEHVGEVTEIFANENDEFLNVSKAPEVHVNSERPEASICTTENAKFLTLVDPRIESRTKFPKISKKDSLDKASAHAASEMADLIHEEDKSFFLDTSIRAFSQKGSSQGFNARSYKSIGKKRALSKGPANKLTKENMGSAMAVHRADISVQHPYAKIHKRSKKNVTSDCIKVAISTNKNLMCLKKGDKIDINKGSYIPS